jgi:hypothetical protein
MGSATIAAAGCHGYRPARPGICDRPRCLIGPSFLFPAFTLARGATRAAGTAAFGIAAQAPNEGASGKEHGHSDDHNDYDGFNHDY